MIQTGPEAISDMQIEFARHNFENQQANIRHLDTKAGVYVSLLVFLIAGGLQLVRDVVSKLQWTGPRAVPSILYVATFDATLVAFLLTALALYRVIRPRGPVHHLTPEASRDMLYADHVLLHKNNSEYFEAVVSAHSELMLRNLTDAIYELCHIIQAKSAALRRAGLPIALSFVFWAASMILSLWIMTW